MYDVQTLGPTGYGWIQVSSALVGVMDFTAKYEVILCHSRLITSPKVVVLRYQSFYRPALALRQFEVSEEKAGYNSA